MRSTLDREDELYHAFPREQQLVHHAPPHATVAFAEAVVVIAGLLIALVIVATLMAL